MIYVKDISKGGYTLVQTPGNPSFLVKKSENPTLQQERTRAVSYSNRYNTAPTFHHLRDFEVVRTLIDDLFDKWQDAVIQLMELRKEINDASHLNPSIEATSLRAYITTIGYLVKLFHKDRTLPCPDIVPSGDGGIDIEWTLDNKFVSVQIHKSNPKNDRIYFRLNGASFESVELNRENLSNLLRQ